jgi:lipid II:glycine glycyltransferase (peptidoglycan interpeptide bridge formation enzyme)
MYESQALTGVLFNALSPDEWSRELCAFDDATIYQTAAYGVVRSRQNNLSRCTVVNDGRVVAMAQVRIASIPVLHTGIAYVGWGPVWRRHGDDIVDEHLSRMLRALRKEFVERRGYLLRIFPPVLTRDPWSESVGAIFKQEGFSLIERPDRTLVVDLRPPWDDLRKGLRKKWRYELGVAEKKEMKVVEGTGERLLDQALVLYREMHKRKQFAESVDTADYMRMQQLLDEPSKLRILVCSLENEPLAAIVYALVGDTGLALMAATSTKALKTNASYVVWWKMLCDLKARGATACDLGGISPEHNPGGYVFKSGMAPGPDADVKYLGQFELCQSASTRLLMTLADRVRKTTIGARARMWSLNPAHHKETEAA